MDLNNPAILYQDGRWRMRLATPADNARLCSLFREVDMSASLCLAEERDPDFFALHQAHCANSYTCVFEDISDTHRDEPRIFGCASILARDAWIDGGIHRIGFACDLRIEPAYRNGHVFPTMIEKFMDFMQRNEGIETMYSAVLSSNERGRNALLNRTGRRHNQPLAEVVTTYNMTSIQFTKSLPRLSGRVTRADSADLDQLVAFLAVQQRKRQFGYVVNHAWLEQRFKQWPGFSLKDFFLVKDVQGRILACTAPWDTEHHIRRSRVMKYQGNMKFLKAAYNIEARLRGFPPLPHEGECFHFVYLTHLEVANEDPDLLNELLRGVYQALQPEPLHFMSLMIPVGSPMERGLQGFRLQRIQMELVAFTTPGTPWHGKSLATLRPGFEMALH